jgi:hypothetical protein
LAGAADENVGKIKLYAWRGPNYISNPSIDEAGVDWVLAENWWPYQRPSFVTPPFAGYVSGHSTYSRAAAEVLTALTGSAYFMVLETCHGAIIKRVARTISKAFR